MRHQNAGRKFSRHAQERNALYRNLIIALFKNGRIKTTEPKAKEIRRHAERLITLAKRAISKAREKGPAVEIAARRRARVTVHEPEVLQSLFADLAVRFAERPGGYTRIIKTSARLGDAAPMAIIELIPGDAAAVVPVVEDKPAKKPRKKAAAAE